MMIDKAAGGLQNFHHFWIWCGLARQIGQRSITIPGLGIYISAEFQQNTDVLCSAPEGLMKRSFAIGIAHVDFCSGFQQHANNLGIKPLRCQHQCLVAIHGTPVVKRRTQL